jgi:hypothetical protein
VNGIETRIRDALDRDVGVAPVRPMPEGTLRRIRIRQAGCLLTFGTGLAALLAVVIALASQAPRRPITPPSTLPSEAQGIQRFPKAIVPPADGVPNVRYGGRFTPYVDHFVAKDGRSDPNVIGEKYVVSYGTVQGVPWSLVGYEVIVHPRTGTDAPEVTGQCAELFFGLGGRDGGSNGCYPVAPGSAHKHLMISGEEIARGKIAVFYGTARTDVAVIELRFEDGTVVRSTPIPGPSELGAGLFIAFEPGSVAGPNPKPMLDGAVKAGSVVAFDASGNELTQGSICMSTEPNSSCAGPR